MRCYEADTCFAQKKRRDQITNEEVIICSILVTTYPDTECPFKKEKKEYTNGVYYPTRKILDKAGVYEIYE